MSSYTIVDDQSSRVQWYGKWDHQSADEDIAWDGTLTASFGGGAGAVFTFRGMCVPVFFVEVGVANTQQGRESLSLEGFS